MTLFVRLAPQTQPEPHARPFLLQNPWAYAYYVATGIVALALVTAFLTKPSRDENTPI